MVTLTFRRFVSRSWIHNTWRVALRRGWVYIHRLWLAGVIYVKVWDNIPARSECFIYSISQCMISWSAICYWCHSLAPFWLRYTPAISLIRSETRGNYTFNSSKTNATASDCTADYATMLWALPQGLHNSWEFIISVIPRAFVFRTSLVWGLTCWGDEFQSSNISILSEYEVHSPVNVKSISTLGLRKGWRITKARCYISRNGRKWLASGHSVVMQMQLQLQCFDLDDNRIESCQPLLGMSYNSGANLLRWNFLLHTGGLI